MAVQRYRFVTDYRSGYGTYAPGQVIEVEPDVAEWINRDIPGCLVEDKPKAAAKAEVEEEAETRAIDKPPADRQMKAATQKRGKEEPITTADFKATVDKG